MKHIYGFLVILTVANANIFNEYDNYMIYNDKKCHTEKYFSMNDHYYYFPHKDTEIVNGINSFTTCVTDYEGHNQFHDDDPQNDNTRVSFEGSGIYGNIITDKDRHIVNMVSNINYTQKNDIKGQFFLSITGFSQYYPSMYTTKYFEYNDTEWFNKTIYTDHSIVIILDSTSLMFYDNTDYNNAVTQIKSMLAMFPSWYKVGIIFHGCENHNVTMSMNKAEIINKMTMREYCRFDTTKTPAELTLTNSMEKAYELIKNDEFKSVIFVSNGKTDLHPNENIDKIIKDYADSNTFIQTVSTESIYNSFMHSLACRGNGTYIKYGQDLWNIMEFFEFDAKPYINTVINIDPYVRGNTTSYIYPAYGYNDGGRYIIGVYGYTKNYDNEIMNIVTRTKFVNYNQTQRDGIRYNSCSMINTERTNMCLNTEKFTGAGLRWYRYYEDAYYEYCPPEKHEPEQYRVCYECFRISGAETCNPKCDHYQFYPCSKLDIRCQYSIGCVLHDYYVPNKLDNQTCYGLFDSHKQHCTNDPVDPVYFCLEEDGGKTNSSVDGYVYDYVRADLVSPTPTPSITPTVTPTVSPSQSATITPSSKPSKSPSNSFSKTPSNSASVSASESISETPTISITSKPSETKTPSSSNAPTPSITPTISVTPSISNELEDNKGEDDNEKIMYLIIIGAGILIIVMIIICIAVKECKKDKHKKEEIQVDNPGGTNKENSDSETEMGPEEDV